MSEPIVLTQHPRAARHLRLAKGWGGLACFALAVLLSLRASVPLSEALTRGVVAGVAGMLFFWAATLAVWRQLAVAEVEAVRRRIEERRAAAAEEPAT